jgi:hypothetical protein
MKTENRVRNSVNIKSQRFFFQLITDLEKGYYGEVTLWIPAVQIKSLHPTVIVQHWY